MNASPERTRRSSLWRGSYIYFVVTAYSFADANIMRVSVEGGDPEVLTPHSVK